MSARTAEVSVYVDAPAERVYEMISDITRMGEWSPETVKVEWLGGARGAAPAGKAFLQTGRGPGQQGNRPHSRVSIRTARRLVGQHPSLAAAVSRPLSVSGNPPTRLARSPTALRSLSRQTTPRRPIILILGNCS